MREAEHAETRDLKRHVPAPIALERRSVPVVLVAIHLDHHAPVEPGQVDLEPLDHHVHRRPRNLRVVTQPKEAALELGARPGDWAVRGKYGVQAAALAATAVLATARKSGHVEQLQPIGCFERTPELGVVGCDGA
jgi:hypothetical protein